MAYYAKEYFDFRKLGDKVLFLASSASTLAAGMW